MRDTVPEVPLRRDLSRVEADHAALSGGFIVIRSARFVAVCLAVLSAVGPAFCTGEEAVRVLPKPPGPAVSQLPPVPVRLAETRSAPLPPPLPPTFDAPIPSAPEAPPTPSVADVADFAAETIPWPDSPSVTLESLEEIALANNPTLVQATAQIRAARGHCLQEGLYPNPTIGYVAEEIGNEGAAGQQGGFVRQEIVTAGKLRLRQNVAGHEVVEAEHAYQSQRRRVLADVRAAWYEILVAQRIVQLNQQLATIADEAVKAATELLEAQEVGRVDVLQAEIEVGSTQLKLHEAENRLAAARKRLAILLGTPDIDLGSISGHLEEELPPLNWDDSLQQLKDGSPQLAEARSAVERARCAVARENAEKTPNLDVRAAVQYDDAVGDSFASVELGMPWPLFNRNQGNICRAQAELTAAKKEVERLDLSLQARLATAFQHYQNAQYDVERYTTEILPKAQASLDLVRSGYRQGEYDYLTLLTAQRTFFRANLAHLESLLQRQTSRVSIEGFLLAGGLDGRP